MRFSSEKERMNHPQAKLFPLSIWSGYFNYELTDSQMAILQCSSTTDLLAQLNALKNLSDIDKMAIFLCCAYKAPVMSDLDLDPMFDAIGLVALDDLVLAAALTGRLYFLNQAAQLSPENTRAKIEANFFAAFKRAAQNGHLDVMNKLIELAPERLQDMIEAGFFWAFRRAAHNGHLDVMNELIRLAPERVQDMIKALSFEAYREAAQNGHLNVMNELIRLAPERVQDMIKARSFEAFRGAARNGHFDVMNKLIAFPAVFAFAEMHARDYPEFLPSFIANKLATLHRRHEARHPSIVVTQQEALLCFYLLRHLMRETPSSEAALTEIDFLMAIPAVKRLLHRPVAEGAPNELLREVMRLNNQVLVERLLAIPAVNEQARRDNFYAEERRGTLDLRALSNFAESSMMALSPLEEAMIQRLEAKYKPDIDEKGVSSAFDETYRAIIKQYCDFPVNFKRLNGVEIELPLTKLEFDAMAKTQNFSVDEKNDATKCYYQHPVHTLYRYLTKGNPWMHPNASLVVVDTVTRERSSDFESFKGLIALLWKAASDVTEIGTDGFTPETRVQAMIKQMALIGRAHNWDKPRRPVLDVHGNQEMEKKGAPKTEQYDDLEGDRPSCFGGVKRRLFQSLIGHPLYLQDIRPVIDSFFRERIRNAMSEHLQEAPTAGLEAIDVEYAQMTQAEDVSEAFNAMMADFEIPSEVISQWGDELHRQYDTAFGRPMIDDSIEQVNRDFFKHAKDLGQFMAVVERCQLLPLCQETLRERADGFLSQFKSAPKSLAFLNETDEWTGQKRWVHALHLGLLGEVGTHLGADEFLSLFKPEMMELLANYGGDVRLKAWLSALEEPQKTQLLNQAEAAFNAMQPRNPSCELDVNDGATSDSSAEEVPLVAFENLPDDPTGRLLEAFEENAESDRLNPATAYRAAISALREETTPSPSNSQGLH